MPHDHSLYVQVLHDGCFDDATYGLCNAFRFRTTNGSGKLLYGPEYVTNESADSMYEVCDAASSDEDNFEYLTRDEVNQRKEHVRKTLKATRHQS